MSKKVQRSNMTQTDSKGQVTREPKDNTDGKPVNFRWWKIKNSSEKAQSISQTLKFIQEHQGNRLEQLTVSTRLYGTSSAFNLMGTAFTRAASVNSNPMSQRISYNLCQSVVDTLTAKMAKNKVIPTYITNGGVWDVQKKAENLTKFTQGVFYAEDVHKKTITAFRDGAVWGDGFLYVYARNKKVCIERVLPHELFVDTIESLVGNPRQLHRVKIMDRDIAAEEFPELKDAIAMVSPANYQEVGGQGTAVDLITVVESWHLKSGPDSDDGDHVISIGDDSYSEPYDKDYFPFPHFSYNQRLLGFYGQGACERLQNIQGEINRNMILIQRSLWMMGSFKLLIENTSKIVSQHLNNDVATIIRYSGVGNEPKYVTPPALQDQIFTWVKTLIDYGYKQEGVSALSAAGEKPMGVDSGKAMRTLTNIEDDRFLFVGQEMETFTLEVARQAIEVIKDIYKDEKSYEVVWSSTNFIETVDWADIDMEKSEYVLKAFPTSSLSDDLTGRLAETQELAQAGMISPRTAKKLMEMPDIEMNEKLSNAAEDLLHKVLEDMLNKGKKAYRAPEPFWDLDLAKQLTLQYYNYAELNNCPDARLELLRKFNMALDEASKEKATAAAAMQMQAQAAAQAQVAPPPGMSPPTALPTATPTSNLIPNTAGASQ